MLYLLTHKVSVLKNSERITLDGNRSKELIQSTAWRDPSHYCLLSFLFVPDTSLDVWFCFNLPSVSFDHILKAM
jgi:hypothetical protein